ncbi:hypothetical protein [Azospirillum sp. B506]|uniref:hypothetical protein n=1 Tax=Azospirillum sp. B506 TaxID=137721 RepID=UPI001FCC5664|nr:hypothetical protein [Azospirillum sp. B506]
MARIVHMGKLGGYAALLGGELLDLEGCILWPSASALSEAVRRAGHMPSDLILDTRSPAPSMAQPTVSAPLAARVRSDGLPLAA